MRVGFRYALCRFAEDKIEQVPRGDDAGALPGRRKVLEVACHQILRMRGLRAFEKDVVFWVRTDA